MLRITQIKSTNRAKFKQYATVEALGLKRIRHSVEKRDTPQIRGMIKRVSHLVKVEEIGDGPAPAPQQGAAQAPQQ